MRAHWFIVIGLPTSMNLIQRAVLAVAEQWHRADICGRGRSEHPTRFRRYPSLDFSSTTTKAHCRVSKRLPGQTLDPHRGSLIATRGDFVAP
jgi:hypothetical protein